MTGKFFVTLSLLALCSSVGPISADWHTGRTVDNEQVALDEALPIRLQAFEYFEADSSAFLRPVTTVLESNEQTERSSETRAFTTTAWTETPLIARAAMKPDAIVRRVPGGIVLIQL